MKQHLNASKLTMMALLTALLSISSYIMIPLPFSGTSLTAQTLVVNLIALLLPPKQSTAVLSTWMLIGLCGIPVYSGGAAGPGRLFGPGGGYIWGMLAAVIFIGILKGQTPNFKRYCAVTIFIGIPVIYLFGAAVMKFSLSLDWSTVFLTSVLPFIPLDIIKCVAASYIALPLSRFISK